MFQVLQKPSVMKLSQKVHLKIEIVFSIEAKRASLLERREMRMSLIGFLPDGSGIFSFSSRDDKLICKQGLEPSSNKLTKTISLPANVSLYPENITFVSSCDPAVLEGLRQMIKI